MDDFDDIERALDRLEAAWADHAHGLRTGVRFMRDTDATEKVLARSLPDVHEAMEGHRRRFEEGHPEALLGALVLAMDENMPVPYWVSVETRARIGRVMGMKDANPVSLHDAFGLGGVIPTSEKRWSKSRADLRREWLLWKETSRLMADGLALDKALEGAIKATAIGLGKTAARKLFLRRDALQKALTKSQIRRNSTR